MDIKIPFVCMLVIGGAIGMLSPAPENGEAPAAGLADENSIDTASLAVAGTAADDAIWGGEVALNRESDGHFYADVVIDGVATRMLVDTGASVIALTGDDAASMGIQWNDADLMPVAQTANGVVKGINTKLRSVAVGDLEAHDVSAMVIPDGLPISLLGQSYLSTIDTVEIADDRLILGN